LVESRASVCKRVFQVCRGTGQSAERCRGNLEHCLGTSSHTSGLTGSPGGPICRDVPGISCPLRLDFGEVAERRHCYGLAPDTCTEREHELTTCRRACLCWTKTGC